MRALLFVGLLTSIASGAAAQNSPPQAGDLFEEAAGEDREFKGWQITGSGYWIDSAQGGCCYTLFKKGGSFIVAITEALVSDRDGRKGTQASKITSVWPYTIRPGQEWATCYLRGDRAKFSAFEASSGVITGVFIREGKFEEIRWLANSAESSETFCETGESAD